MKHFYKLSWGAILSASVIATNAYGAATPPCSLAIDSQEAFDQWTVYDVNNDGEGHLWSYSPSDEGALYVENKKQAANDWLISPPIEFTAGATYSVTAYVQNKSTLAYDKQKIALYYGDAAQPDAMPSSNLIVKNESLSKSSWPVELKGKMTATTSGEGYIGIHLFSSSYNGDCLVTKIEIEKVATHPGAVTNLTITPGEDGALDAQLKWTWPTLNDQGGSLENITGAYIYRGTSNSLSATDTYLVGTYNVTATPGSEGEWKDETLQDPGKYYYMVVPFNADGSSVATPQKVQSAWIGLDKPGNVSNVKATPNDENDKEVFITFDYPVGQNGGYVDLSKVSYKITRTGLGEQAVTLEESWQGELPYTDSTIPGLNSYTYQVYTIYNGSPGFSGSKSNTVVTGGTLSLPYSNTFDNDNSIALWTKLNAGKGSRDWAISYSKLDYWGAGSPVDAYAVLPPFSLEPGKAYNISFTTYINKQNDPKPLYIMLGREPLADSLDTQLYYEMIESTFSADKEVSFSVEEAGDYYIAFRVYGDISGANDLYVDNLKIEEVTVAPLAPGDFKAEPLPEGELGAKLSWVNPNESNAGTSLSTITKLEILRNGKLIETLEDLTPGEEATFTDNGIEQAGTYDYTLIPYLGEEAGAAVKASTDWIGPDTPKAPASVTVTLDEDGNRLIEFTPVSESVHGGYVDYEALTYTIFRDEEEIAEGVATTSYTDSAEGLSLASYTYGVAAVADTIASATTEAAPIVFGGALNLPYTPDFNTASTFDIWTFTNPTNEGKDWKYESSKDAIKGSYTGAWAITPPFKAYTGKCAVTFKATCFSARYPEDLEIYLIKDISDLDSAEKIGEHHVESVSWPSDVVIDFPIEQDGTYNIGYKLVTPSPWDCYLYKSDVAQTAGGVETGLDEIFGDEADLKYIGSTNEILLPGKGSVSIFDTTGLEVVHLTDIEGAVSVDRLADATYIVIYTSAEGEQKKLKFRK